MDCRHRRSGGGRTLDWIPTVTDNVKKNYSSEELSKMSNDELARLGTELDDVTIAYRK